MKYPNMTASHDGDYEDSRLKRNISSENSYFKGALFLVFIFVFLLLVIRVIINPGTFPIRSVRIEGEFRHLSPGVLKAGVADVVRGGFFDVNVETIQKALMKNAWVDKVSVHRIWPDGLKVQVTERVPVARWNNEGLLSSDGTFFIPEDKYSPENLPVLSGPENTYRLLLSRYEYISKTFADKQLEIEELILNNRGAWGLKLRSGVTLIIGKGPIDRRITRFKEYAWPALQDDKAKIFSIDMRYTNGFVVSWNEINEQNSDTGKEDHG